MYSILSCCNTDAKIMRSELISDFGSNRNLNKEILLVVLQ